MQPFQIATGFYTPGETVVAKLQFWRGGVHLYERPLRLEIGDTPSDVTFRVDESCERVQCPESQACLDDRCVADTCFDGSQPSCP